MPGSAESWCRRFPMDDGLTFPAFILGLSRSGTTLLYEMLAASGCFNVVTARHVICFDELRDGRVDRERSRARLQKRFERLRLSTRGVDVVRLGPDTPEEYGFILDNLLGFGAAITRRNFPVFRHICEVIQRDCGRDRRLLLKNPWDFGNGRLIKALMPGAKIVYIHRNPFHVLGSRFRLDRVAVSEPSAYLSMLCERYREFMDSDFPLRVVRALWDRYPGLIARWLVHQTSWSTSGYLRSLSSVPPEDRIHIRYETLCAHPNETMGAILSHFGVDGATRDYGAMIGTHASRVPAEIAAQRDLVVRKLSGYAAAVGYALPELAEVL